ncbi:hypothetical protein [Pseudomonas kurunegalensis]|uniref:hypothetical protein n=1 Tax=Pseudomonas kurunegalensis TaxID=485880 RepID=UPI003260E9F2
MKTLDLQGNLFNLNVALAMGGFDESSGSWASPVSTAKTYASTKPLLCRGFHRRN